MQCQFISEGQPNCTYLYTYSQNSTHDCHNWNQIVPVFRNCSLKMFLARLNTFETDIKQQINLVGIKSTSHNLKVHIREFIP